MPAAHASGAATVERPTLLPPAPSERDASADRTVECPALGGWEEPDDTLAWLDQQLSDEMDISFDDLDDDFGGRATPVRGAGTIDTAIVTKVR